MHRVFALLAIALFLSQGFAQTDLPEGYAGLETCGACHEDIARSFGGGAHRLIAERASGAWTGRECESCHGAGGEHSETTDVEKIFGFRGAGSDRINQACLECHEGEDTHRGRLFGAHYRQGVDCLGCHAIHSASEAPLLTKESDALCSSCHIAERAAFRRPFTHRLEQKAIGCVDCHNPHGGPPPGSMRRFAANELPCLQCHADKRGPFPFEHAPVRLETCTTCHEPHGSANPRMMVRSEVSQLCLECHTMAASTLGGPPTAFHDLRSARFRNCTVCHSKTHGSFLSPDFLR
jgi:DmsE family decaheme c-type cytochrome